MERFSRELEFFGSVNRNRVPLTSICLFGFDPIVAAILESLVVIGYRRFRVVPWGKGADNAGEEDRGALAAVEVRS